MTKFSAPSQEELESIVTVCTNAIVRIDASFSATITYALHEKMHMLTIFYRDMAVDAIPLLFMQEGVYVESRTAISYAVGYVYGFTSRPAIMEKQ